MTSYCLSYHSYRQPPRLRVLTSSHTRSLNLTDNYCDIIECQEVPAPPGCRTVVTQSCRKVPVEVQRKLPDEKCEEVPDIVCHLELEKYEVLIIVDICNKSKSRSQFLR